MNCVEINSDLDNPLHNLLPKEVQDTQNGTSNTTDDFVFIQLTDSDGLESGSPIWIPLSVDVPKLTVLLKDVLDQVVEVDSVYDFFVGNIQILDDLKTALVQARAKGTEVGLPKPGSIELENVVKVIYQAQSIFRVRPVTRCSSSLPGHKGAVLVAQFSPDGRSLASGSGDQTVRFWDLNTELPINTGTEAHKGPVLCLSWSPNALYLASGCQAGLVCIWSRSDVSAQWSLIPGSPLGRAQTSRSSQNCWIRTLAWRPLHLDPDCTQLAVAYQDTSIVLWNIAARCPILTISGHAKPVVSIKWGGTDLIYSASHDRTIRVWRAKDGVLCRTLNLHGHWVNCLALSTDYILRTGPFDPAKLETVDANYFGSVNAKTKMADCAKALYDKVKGTCPERLVSGSDDNTLSLWKPEVDKKPIAPRMVGHQGVINDVKFSPDGRLLASASFDHSVKIWDGFTGQFLATMFGHVQEVYLVTWSSDSRLLVSCSKDSTLKLWSVAESRRWNQEDLTLSKEAKKRRIVASDVGGGGKTTKAKAVPHQRKRHLLHDLPGHADAVYSLDWSPDGQYVVSGGKDRILKFDGDIPDRSSSTWCILDQVPTGIWANNNRDRMHSCITRLPANGYKHTAGVLKRWRS